MILVNKLTGYRVFSTFDLRSAYYQLPLCEVDKTFTIFEANKRLYQSARLPLGVISVVATFLRFIDKFVDEENLTNMFVYLDNINITGRDQTEHKNALKGFLRPPNAKNSL